ncbi:DUF6798 domain-containing protein [Candidatus Pelagibacter sp.]|uniref:DUF6798 domain-containing protein n=1 Tax=Candidatus Pelagibacter sp. TaxID=2024849 RepID=UPI003F84B1D9
MEKKITNNDLLINIFLSFLFVLTIQIFDPFRGNAAHLIHSIKYFETNKLENDWIANQAHHLPVFVQFNYFLIKFFSSKIIYFIHGVLLALCALYLFLISKSLFPKLETRNFTIIWFALFTILFHENSFFSGVAGQSVIDAGYQPASFGILFFIGIYYFLIKKYFLCILFICLSASFHPTYILHSGFLVLGILTHFILSKNYQNFLKILILYSMLILPITLFIFINFLTVDENLTSLGQEILLDRIPHHANIRYWLSYKDLFFLVTYIYALYIIRNNKQFFIFFLIFGTCPILLSLIQYFYDINSLALAFPWRSSVFITPISSVIILSSWIEKIKSDENKIKIVSFSLLLLVSSFFFIKSNFIKDLNSEFSKKLVLPKKIKKNFNSIDRILIPTNLDYIRMYTGLPIFIDWKHHAFRFDQLIEWRQRMDLANEFYSSKNIKAQSKTLEEIQKIEDISHILIRRDKLKIDCDDLINHEKFILVSVKDCYEN